MPFRKILRALDKKNELAQIPTAHGEKKDEFTYWYLVREGAQYVPKDEPQTISKKELAKIRRESSDEFYVINLCDEILKQKASRQHTFDFLLGDEHKDGSKSRLTLDAYYHKSQLVIEFFEGQGEKTTTVSKMTSNGISRIEQKAIYDKRKKETLTEKNINFFEIDYTLFECNAENKLLRNKENDVIVLKKILQDFI